jgi:hypothetical protein
MPPTASAAIGRNAKPNINPAEWEQRVTLAACYRLVEHFGWTDLIYTHISARVPGEPGHFLLNRFGLLFDEVTASNLIKVDLDGNLIDDPDAPMHGRLRHPQRHPRRPRGRGLRDPHPFQGRRRGRRHQGWALADQPACPAVLRARELSRLRGARGRHRRAPAAHPRPRRQSGDDPAQPRPAGGRPSIPLAFSNLFNLQFACETQVLATAGGAALNVPPAAVSAHTAKLAVAPEAPFGTEWPGLLRMLDRKDASYRT